MNNYKIWVSYHKDDQVTRFGLKGDKNHEVFGTHLTPEGKNINHMNPVYSEMVTMWYVWQNAKKSDYVGFNHYRRRFEVSRLPGKGECQVYRMLDFGDKTVYEQYAECHNVADMDTVLKILERRYGKGNAYVRNIRESSRLVANCCFLMKWNDFVRLCRFLFPVLEDFASENGISNTNVEEWARKAEKDFGGSRTEYQTRAVSFLAERLISAWIVSNLSPYIGGRDVAVVHYNTPALLEAAIRSLMKHTPCCHVYVFDNSDKAPFKAKIPNVEVIDNTKGKIIDFDAALAAYPDKKDLDRGRSNFGSAKHAMSVDKLMDLIPGGFVLMDSDVLFTANISSLWDRNTACIGSEDIKHNVPLLQPFLCWLNVPMLREAGIRYFNGEKMWALSEREPDCWYDTGAWLLEEVRRLRLPNKYTNIWKYVMHLGHGSWKDDGSRADEWLKENEGLWK